MLKIQRSARGEIVFRLTGRMDEENIGELNAILSSEGPDQRILLDLTDLTLVDRDAVVFLDHCEKDSIKLVNCPSYIREWIIRERNAGTNNDSN